MPPLEALLVLTTASLAGIGLVGAFVASAWAGWLRLRAYELDHARADDLPAIGQRIDLADLKERIRKL
jgi:hypothetical protein